MLWVLIRIASHMFAILMSTHNIGFYGELMEIILQLSLNTLLICSSGLLKDLVLHKCSIEKSKDLQDNFHVEKIIF